VSASATLGQELSARARAVPARLGVSTIPGAPRRCARLAGPGAAHRQRRAVGLRACVSPSGLPTTCTVIYRAAAVTGNPSSPYGPAFFSRYRDRSGHASPTVAARFATSTAAWTDSHPSRPSPTSTRPPPPPPWTCAPCEEPVGTPVSARTLRSGQGRPPSTSTSGANTRPELGDGYLTPVPPMWALLRTTWRTTRPSPFIHIPSSTYLALAIRACCRFAHRGPGHHGRAHDAGLLRAASAVTRGCCIRSAAGTCRHAC